jgi:hypothetical protein
MDIAFGLVKVLHTAWLYQRTERRRDVPAESRPSYVTRFVRGTACPPKRRALTHRSGNPSLMPSCARTALQQVRTRLILFGRGRAF